MSLQIKDGYEFGPFRLEPAERLLLREGRCVPLPPKAFETLLLLVKNSGHVLTKDELMHAIWPDSFVEENNLTQHISMLRKNLGKLDGNEYIETVPRLGYRFVAQVRENSAGAEALLFHRQSRMHVVVSEEQHEEETDIQPQAMPAALPTPNGKTSRLSRRIIVTISALAILIVGVFSGVRWYASRPAARQPQALAVLPFRNLKPSPDTDFLSYSLADAVIARLGYVSGLVVRPASYVAKYHDSLADPREVAQQLHVESMLTGSYLRDKDRLLVSVELVDTSKAEVLWRDKFSVPYDQLFTVQDLVADNVIRSLRVRVLPEEEKRLRKSAPRNFLAYEYYLRAADLGLRNEYALQIPILEKAVSLQPDFATAYVTLGTAYAAYGAFQGGGDAYMQKSKEAYGKALALLPDQPFLHSMMATQLLETGDLDDGLSSLQAELQLDPNEPLTHWLLNQAYRYAGMLPESVAEGERALQLDPFVARGSTFNTYLYLGQYQKFLDSLPAEESARTTFYRGLCFFYMQDFSRAAAEFQSAYRLDPSLLHAKYGKALLFAIHNENAQGIAYLREVEGVSPTRDGEMLYKVAQAYAVLGDNASALRALRQAIQRNFYCYSCFVRDPLLRSLHGDREYEELLEIAHQRQTAFHKKYF